MSNNETDQTRKSTSKFRVVGGFILNRFKSKSQRENIEAKNEVIIGKKSKRTFFKLFDRNEKQEKTNAQKVNTIEKGKRKLVNVDTSDDTNLNEIDLKLEAVKAVPLNNSMAKSKIQAASRRKFSNRQVSTISELNEPMSVISEQPTNEDTECVKPNENFKLSLEKIMKKSYSVDVADPRPKSQNEEHHKFSSKENLNIPTENIIENAKKILKKSDSNKKSKLMRSVDNLEQSNPQPFHQLKKADSNKSENKSINNINTSFNDKKDPFGSYESIKIPKFIGSIENLKPSERQTSKTSIKSANDVCKFLTCSSNSNSNSSSENLDHNQQLVKEIDLVKNSSVDLKIFEEDLPIYDNFSLPENSPNTKIDKSTSDSDKRVYRLPKKGMNTSTKKFSLADQQPNDEFQNCIQSKLRNNSRSTQEIYKLSELTETPDNPINEHSNGNFRPNNLSYSKSLKVKQKTNVTHIDKVCDLKSKEIPSQSCTNKVILVTKNENTRDAKVNSDEKIIPLKKVSDLIKDLNGGNKASTTPAWKDNMLKKKNSCSHRKSTENTDPNNMEKNSEIEFVADSDACLVTKRSTSRVKSIILGIEDK